MGAALRLYGMAVLVLALGACSDERDVANATASRESLATAKATTTSPKVVSVAARTETHSIRVNQYRREGDEGAAKDFADRNGFASCRFTGSEESIALEKLFAEVECSKTDSTLRSPPRFEVNGFPPKFHGKFSEDCSAEPANMEISVSKDEIGYWEAVFEPSLFRFNGRSTIESDGTISWYDDGSPDGTGSKSGVISLTILKDGRLLFVENDDIYLLKPCPRS